MIRWSFLLFFLPGYYCAEAQDAFQQSVDYSINVALDDVAHVLNGDIRIIYGNNSPNNLDTIWLHLWPNGYKDRFSSLCKQQVDQNDFGLHFANAEEKGDIQLSSFLLDGEQASWGIHPLHDDIAWVKPDDPLLPSESVTLEMNFIVKIPSGKISRLGHIGKSYQITQWYPKPAVYDSDGWHIMPYLGQGEFFSEFASFNVHVTLPSNYRVAATGDLMNPEEVAWLDSLSQADTQETLTNTFPESSDSLKTLHFVQDNVHDFAWFADIRYIVRKGSVTLPRSKREVTTWAMYTPRNSAVWEKSIEFINESTLAYSYWVGDYPYSHVTAVDGTISAGGGMEYPMITVIGDAGSSYELDIVISHEVGHNWFYGILASNEREHPWLDEGLNSFIEMQHISSRYKELFGNGIGKGLAFGGITPESQQGYRYQSEMGYLFQARRGKDQPLNGHSESFTPTNYGAMVYGKTALVFDMLLAYLGTERFIKCMNLYFDKWAFNHPGPSDIRAVFEEVSGEDLEWCFGQLVGTDKKFDPIAVKLTDSEFTYRINGGLLAPFPITAWSGDKMIGSTWVRPDSEKGSMTLPWVGVDRIRIDHRQRTLDLDRTNNHVATTGLLKRANKLKFKYLTGVERADREQFYWALLPAYNTADGFMLGPVIYNSTLPVKRTEFVLAPMYGFSSGNLTGAARVGHHFDRSDSWTRGLSIALNARRSGLIEQADLEALYSKVSFSIAQELFPQRIKKSVTPTLSYRGVWIQEASKIAVEGETLSKDDERLYHEINLGATRSTGLNPFEGRLNALYKEGGFLRADLEFEVGAILNKKNDRFDLRVFAGKFFQTEEFDSRTPYFTAGTDGTNDLLYDGLFVGRYEEAGLWPQQFLGNMGGFKSPTTQGVSSDYLLAANIELDLPFVIPLALFASASNSPVKKTTVNGTTTENKTLYEAGIGLRIVRDIFEVWVPLTYSEDIKDEFDFTDTPFHERIRFTLDLTKIDPTRFIRSSAP